MQKIPRKAIQNMKTGSCVIVETLLRPVFMRSLSIDQELTPMQQTKQRYGTYPGTVEQTKRTLN